MRAYPATVLWLLATSVRASHFTKTRDPDGFLSPTVTVSAGAVAGTRVILPSALAIADQFWGVPYAKSPPRRFEPPEPPEPWDGVLEAKKPQPACIQQFAYPKPNQDINHKIFNTPPSEESEDCLYLNVFRSEAPGVGKPVMFWLYPGGLQFGDASRPIYDGSILAAYHDVIVVVPNFRSNVFGFSNSPELELTAQNAGFWDQRLALAWVQENIAAFGGDPKRVTVFGNSAGGTSIDRLLTTWPVDPPFQAAIIQSGQASFAPYHLTDGPASWAQLAEHFECSQTSSALACLREVPAADIKAYIEETGILFIPVTDNVTQLSAADARRARQARNVANVPLLVGSNGQEGSAFWRHAPDDLDGFLRIFFAGDEELQHLVNLTYPSVPGPEGAAVTTYQRLASIFTDLVFTCPTSLLASSNADARLPTWRYFYNASFPELAPLPGLGAYHTGEVPLVFGTYPAANATPAALATSSFLQRAWTEFAKNPIAGPGWNKLGAMGTAADLAYLDETFSGVQLKDPQLVDSKCWIFQRVYDRIEDPPWAWENDGSARVQVPLGI